MNAFQILYDTNAYKIFHADKVNGTLSHAILVVCEDKYMLDMYLKVFAKELMCASDTQCGECRTCKLIEEDAYQDVITYQKEKKLSVAEIDELVAKTFLKPLEGDKKAFVILNAEDMSDKCQNKLLKTLEEPPKNTYFILGASNLSPILPTVLSRVKRLDILPFTDEKIKKYLSNDNFDENKLAKAISLSNGKIGEVIQRYNSGEGLEMQRKVKDILLNMQNSGQVLKYSSTIKKEEFKDFLNELSRVLSTAIRYKSNACKIEDGDVKKIANEFSYGALVYALDVVRKYEKSERFYGNLQVMCDGVLFGILEGKYKCSK